MSSTAPPVRVLVVDDDPLVRAATVALHPDATPKAVVLWAGFNIAIWLSVGVIAIGSLLLVWRTPVTALQNRVHRPIAALPTAEQSFWALVKGALRNAKRVTRVVQNGSLPVYLQTIGRVRRTGGNAAKRCLLLDLPGAAHEHSSGPCAATRCRAAVSSRGGSKSGNP